VVILLIPIDVSNGLIKKESKIENISFASLKLKESDVEEFIRRNVDTIIEDESILIVGQQVFDTNNGRSDLIAIDETGSLVVLEIKRDKEDMIKRKEPLELQCMRYAAALAKIRTIDELVENIFAPYIEKYKTEFDLKELSSFEKGKRIVREFLTMTNSLNTFNNAQRIIVVASDFDDETLSTLTYMSENLLFNLCCFKIQPVVPNDKNYVLNVDKLLPLSKPEDFYPSIKDPKLKEDFSDSKTKRKVLPRMDMLFKWDILKSGDFIYFKDTNKDETKAKVIDSNTVEFNGEIMSYIKWGCKITGWATIQIYKFAILLRLNKDLYTLREEKMKELNLDF
jgi:hypothetical protein